MYRFKTIPGFSRYEINRIGLVRVVGSKKAISIRLSKRNRAQYYELSLVDDAKNKTTQYLHRMIAMAWIKNPNNYPCVNHINEIKTDNSIENLEWCTYSQNNSHNNRAKRVARRRKLEGSYNSPFKKECGKFTLSGILVEKYESGLKAQKSNFGDVYKNLTGVSKTCGGFVFKYL